MFDNFTMTEFTEKLLALAQSEDGVVTVRKLMNAAGFKNAE